MSAIDVVSIRLSSEEGFRPDAYDDATGLPIKVQGQPTIGYGCRLRQWSRSLALTVLAYQVKEIDNQLRQYTWYCGLDTDPIRQSVPLDVAFNGGVSGLLHYPLMIHALAVKNWEIAAANCTDKDPKLDASRYAPLRQILLKGV